MKREITNRDGERVTLVASTYSMLDWLEAVEMGETWDGIHYEDEDEGYCEGRD